MNNSEFIKKLSAVRTVPPDQLDIKLLAEIDAERISGDKGRSLRDIISEREYNGKILLRIPKELHAELALTAKKQGVSLNQYCLYRLSHGAADAGVKSPVSHQTRENA